MNILQDPQVKETYDKCRYTVKLWENQFKKDNGRLPSKLDIREAAKEVRNAYKTYFHLKTAALEESLTNIEGFDVGTENTNGDTTQHSTILDSSTTQQLTIPNELESSEGKPFVPEHHENLQVNNRINTEDTWGIHLSNNKSHTVKGKKKCEKPKINLSFSKKLFEHSKTSSKRFSRKSLSFNRKKSESDSTKPQFHSQPDSTFSESLVENVSFQSESDTVGLSNVKTATPTYSVHSQSINIIQNAIAVNETKPLRDLDEGWIQRLTNNVSNELLPKQNNIEQSKLDYDSEEVIDNSEDDEENSCSLYHIAKKYKLSTSSIDSEPRSIKMPTIDITSKRLDFTNILNTKTKDNVSTTVCELKVSKQEGTNKTAPVVIDTSKDHPISNNSVRKSNRNRKTLIDISQEQTEENEDPFASDNDTNDPEFKPEQDNNKQLSYLYDICDNEVKDGAKPKSSAKIKENKRTRVKKPLKGTVKDLPNEENSLTYELEYSVKPRTVTVPRINNLKTVVATKIKTSKSDEKVDSNQKSNAEKKLKQKIESGSLNDNYVQINLRKKIFVRGKSNFTFNKYKKQQWKKKKTALYGPDMDMGGCDGGTLTCFNCGQTGHFARNCKANKGDALLPLDGKEEVEECPYPTLEEAAKMAEESSLAIRKPNYKQHSTQKDVIEETSMPIENNEEEIQLDEDDEELLAEVERIEQEIAKIDVQRYIDSTTHVRPYYSTEDDGSIIETPQEVFDVLHKFGHETFRPGQEQAIMRILSGKSTLVTLSTGSGKSLCYQLPAYLYSTREPCISLIISPLVSLMEDQVTGIPGFLKAACLHTNQTKTQRDKIMDTISSGHLNILLVSPEAVVAGEKSSGFGSLLRKLPPIAFACIDEAHCVSQWSHNFRPSYLKICRVLRDKLGVNTVLGLTATATRTTSDGIIKHLNIPDGEKGIIKDIPLPDNLRLTVSCDAQKDQALVALLQSDRFKDCKSIIIYCTRREECQRVATYLRTCLKNEGIPNSENKKRKRFSLQAEPYHAGLSASRRRSIQKAFMSGELRIVVATVAFGMGINKSDIRAVIHYNMPMNFESYVQEVGRAGRDSLPAHCHLFLDSQGKDENELCRHIYANTTDRHVIRKLLQRTFVPCSCKNSCPGHEVGFSIEETIRTLDIPEENVETLLCYLELHNKYRVELLSHAYVTCKIISYGGPTVIRKAAKDCPPLAMALALYQKENQKEDNVFQFPVVDVASAMGWDSGICKHKLKNLEWITENNQPKRSKLSVQFLNLGFRLSAPGNLTEPELDEALDDLYNHVKEQERTSLLQLHAIHTTLRSVSNPTFKSCIVLDKVLEKEDVLKSKIREYFESPKPLELLPEIETKPLEEEQIVADIRSVVCMYRDNSFTGRAIARIFHGIQSPNYPAVIWGRCKFWRAHLGADFNTLCQIATREILRMR